MVIGDEMKPVIIYPPTIDWDYLHQRPQQLLKALARLGCVGVFCNINLHQLHPAGITYLNDDLVLANGISFGDTVQWARAAYPRSPIVAYFTYPPHITKVRPLKFDLTIFDSVDEPTGEFANWLPSYAEAVQTADEVLASAGSLAERAHPYAANQVHLIPNGCDYEHFRTAQTRRKLYSQPFSGDKPIIGYIGTIAPWLDRVLINSMARCLPEYEFVFIGPLLLQHGVAITSSNMHFLGHRDYEDLPRYLSNFSYCLIPFKLTEMTKGVNPVKFWEYLASGIPILSTQLPEIPPEYVTLVTDDLFPGFSPVESEAGRDARIALASDNSWTNRAAKLLEIIRGRLECG